MPLSGPQFFPPSGYYKQSGRAAHPSAKGVDYHLKQLEDKLHWLPGGKGKGKATFTTTGDTHRITVNHQNGQQSHLSWATAAGVKTTEGRTIYRPGEIKMVHSRVPGAGIHLHDAARAIARDNPDEVAVPRHSVTRTPQGREWVPKQMDRYGEPVWGAPPVGHPDEDEYAARVSAGFQIQARRRINRKQREYEAQRAVTSPAPTSGNLPPPPAEIDLAHVADISWLHESDPRGIGAQGEQFRSKSDRKKKLPWAGV